MRTSLISNLITTIIFSISLNIVYAQYGGYNQYNEQQYSNRQYNEQRYSNNGNLTFKPSKNTYGQVINYLPVLQDWDIPNYNDAYKPFMIAGDKAEVYMGNPRLHDSRPRSAEQVFNEALLPIFKQNGGTVINTFALPKLMKNIDKMNLCYQVMAYNVGESQFDNERWRAYKNSRAGSSSSSSSSSASPSSSSSGTDDFLRGVIKEEQTVTGGGYSGDVSMHKKYTWVNESGETMQTNDPNYNPNSDTSTYHHNWSLMQNQ